MLVLGAWGTEVDTMGSQAPIPNRLNNHHQTCLHQKYQLGNLALSLACTGWVID